MAMQQMLLGNVPLPKKYIEDVFTQTDYMGNGSSGHVINQGFDYTTDGGMALIKSITNNRGGIIVSTESGGLNGDGSSKVLHLHMGNGYKNETGSITLTSTGITYGDGGAYWNEGHGFSIASFKKAPGFFDIVQFSGNSTARAISHNLGTVPGMIWLKRTSGAGDVGDFWVYHKQVTSNPNQYFSLRYNTARQTDSPNLWDVSQMTTSSFGLGTNAKTNGTGNDYIAFLFSDGDDQTWGPNQDERIIRCGSYTGNGSTNEDSPKSSGVGFEVSWHLNKPVNMTGGTTDWTILSDMVGYGSRISTNRKGWYTNSENAVFSNQYYGYNSITGPQMWETNVNVSSQEYFYLSIRRMGQKPITTAAEAFYKVAAISSSTVPPGNFRLPTAWINANRKAGFLFEKRENSSNDYQWGARLNGGKSWTSDSDNGHGTNSQFQFGGMGNIKDYDTNHKGSMWPRVKGYFDVQEFEGKNQTITVDHDLGVVPDMIWIKCGAANLMVSSPSIDNNGVSWTSCMNIGALSGSGSMNQSRQDELGYGWHNGVAPTATTITLKGSTDANQYKWSNGINSSPPNLNAMYLFKTIPGISKVGRVACTGSGGGVGVNCGFTNGVAFLIVKRVNGGGGGTSDWWCTTSLGASSSYMGRLNMDNYWDTSSRILSNGTSGFRLKGDMNYSGSSYWYYAVAA